MGGHGQVDIAAYYRRYRAHDPHFQPNSGFYDRFRMLAAFFLDRKGWSVQRLLDTPPDAGSGASARWMHDMRR